MEIIEKNRYAGTEKPEELIETPYSKECNEGIYGKSAVNCDGSTTVHWYIAQSTKLIYEQQIADTNESQDELIAVLLEKRNGTPTTEQSAAQYTAEGKLYARLVHTGRRRYPTDIPPEYVKETYNAYTGFYRYTPELVPPNEKPERQPESTAPGQ